MFWNTKGKFVEMTEHVRELRTNLYHCETLIAEQKLELQRLRGLIIDLTSKSKRVYKKRMAVKPVVKKTSKLLNQLLKGKK